MNFCKLTVFGILLSSILAQAKLGDMNSLAEANLRCDNPKWN